MGSESSEHRAPICQGHISVGRTEIAKHKILRLSPRSVHSILLDFYTQIVFIILNYVFSKNTQSLFASIPLKMVKDREEEEVTGRNERVQYLLQWVVIN